MPKVTFVHYADAEPEIGIQFEADDGAGGTVTGRAFAPIDPALKAAVLADAQAKLDAMAGELPANLPPGAVTPALMQKRNAQQEAAKAVAAKRQADEERSAAEQAKSKADADRVQLEAAANQAATECAAAMAEKERLAAELAALDAELAAKRAEAAKA